MLESRRRSLTSHCLEGHVVGGVAWVQWAVPCLLPQVGGFAFGLTAASFTSVFTARNLQQSERAGEQKKGLQAEAAPALLPAALVLTMLLHQVVFWALATLLLTTYL